MSALGNLSRASRAVSGLLGSSTLVASQKCQTVSILSFVRGAHKKVSGTSNNGHNSAGRRLGVKRSDGMFFACLFIESFVY